MQMEGVYSELSEVDAGKLIITPVIDSGSHEVFQEWKGKELLIWMKSFMYKNIFQKARCKSDS